LGSFYPDFCAWRFLLVKWTRPAVGEIEAAIGEIKAELTPPYGDSGGNVEEIIERIIVEARNDRPVWEDWATFWQRCQDLVSAIAHIYYPDVKYPLLNIYIPQAYGLIRGTVDDSDRWMQNLSPALIKSPSAKPIRPTKFIKNCNPQPGNFGKSGIGRNG